MPLLLDTTVLIDALRDRPVAGRLRELRDADRVPWICAVNVDEVLRGTGAEEEALVARFLGGLHLAPLGRTEGERAGRWRRDFARKGVALSQGDCLIAAAAVGVDARLITGNPKHFPMPELDLEHWPVGT
ncbi:MAG TPA: PIN domain-containing protein [Solirubrobacteraceae bacterium]|nr:PIN domain-containing protein [Solirubrobacteraceae bacterium]